MKNVNWSESYSIIHSSNKGYILVGAGVFVTAYCVKWYRWHCVLRNIHTIIKVKHSAPSFFISFLINNILPLRAGEVFRIVHAAQKAVLQKRKVACSVFLDRIFDGLALVILLGLAISYFKLPAWIVTLFYERNFVCWSTGFLVYFFIH